MARRAAAVSRKRRSLPHDVLAGPPAGGWGGPGPGEVRRQSETEIAPDQQAKAQDRRGGGDAEDGHGIAPSGEVRRRPSDRAR
jgi:hypothetical protein